jgi:hypothetical protein
VVSGTIAGRGLGVYIPTTSRPCSLYFEKKWFREGAVALHMGQDDSMKNRNKTTFPRSPDNLRGLELIHSFRGFRVFSPDAVQNGWK